MLSTTSFQLKELYTFSSNVKVLLFIFKNEIQFILRIYIVLAREKYLQLKMVLIFSILLHFKKQIYFNIMLVELKVNNIFL